MKYKLYSYDDYEKAMKMFKEGIGITTISKTLGILRSTLHYWRHDKHRPPSLKWQPRPTGELAYVIGVLKGKANIRVHTRHHDIRLQAKDYEFVYTFSLKLAKTLNKPVIKPYPIRRANGWEVNYTSKAFYTWYKNQNLETLKPIIEQNRENVKQFLKGLYDSDGETLEDRINPINKDPILLSYVKHLLKKYFGIDAEGPYREGEKDRACGYRDIRIKKEEEKK